MHGQTIDIHDSRLGMFGIPLYTFERELLVQQIAPSTLRICLLISTPNSLGFFIRAKRTGSTTVPLTLSQGLQSPKTSYTVPTQSSPLNGQEVSPSFSCRGQRSVTFGFLDVRRTPSPCLTHDVRPDVSRPSPRLVSVTNSLPS